MNEASPPFAAPPAPTAVGVPLNYYRTWDPQQQQQQQQQQTQPHYNVIQTDVNPTVPVARRKPSTPVVLSFPYGVRCAVYSVVLVLSLCGCGFAIAELCSDTYMTFNLTYTNGDILQMTVLSDTNNWLGSIDEPYDDYLISGLESSGVAPWHFSAGVVAPPAEVRAATAVAIVDIIFTLLLAVFVSVVLGILGCQRRREEHQAAAKETAEVYRARQEQQEVYLQQLVQEANTGGAPVTIIVNNSTNGPTVFQQTANARRVAEAYDAKVAHDAKVRQGMCITCLVFSIICLVMSIVGLACGVAGESVVKHAVDLYLASYPSPYSGVSYSKALSSLSVWPNIPNLVLYVITTVLLCVPFLSGIADRPAVRDQTDEETRAAAEADGAAGEEMQANVPLYVSPCHTNANKNNNNAQTV